MSTEEKLIFKKIPAIMRELEAVTKNKKNQMQGFMYRGIDDFYNAVHPLFAKHGVFSVPTVVKDKREVRINHKGTELTYVQLVVRYDFFAEDGSSITAEVTGEGMDSGDKASNKAMSIAHKYALIQIFAIPTEDATDDPDAETHYMQPKDQKRAPLGSNSDTKVDASKRNWRRLYGLAAEKFWSHEMVKTYSREKFKKNSGLELTDSEYHDLLDTVSTKTYTEASKTIGVINILKGES